MCSGAVKIRQLPRTQTSLYSASSVRVEDVAVCIQTVLVTNTIWCHFAIFSSSGRVNSTASVCVHVRVCVNQSDQNANCYTQSLVILCGPWAPTPDNSPRTFPQTFCTWNSPQKLLQTYHLQKSPQTFPMKINPHGKIFPRHHTWAACCDSGTIYKCLLSLTCPLRH